MMSSGYVTITVTKKNEQSDPFDLFPEMEDNGMGAINAVDDKGEAVDLPEDIHESLLKWAGYKK